METIGRITMTVLWLLISMVLTIAGVEMIRGGGTWLGGFGCAAIMFSGDALDAARKLWTRRPA